MQTVYVVTNPELGWDCVVGVFTDVETMIKELHDEHLEPLEDLDDFKTEKVKEIEQFLNYGDVQNTGVTAKSLLESIVKEYYDNL